MSMTGSDKVQRNPSIAALCVRRDLPVKSANFVTENIFVHGRSWVQVRLEPYRCLAVFIVGGRLFTYITKRTAPTV
jgi:hypothetical protein